MSPEFIAGGVGHPELHRGKRCSPRVASFRMPSLRLKLRWQGTKTVRMHAPVSESRAGGRVQPDLRTAALVEAIERVSRVTLERGIWP